MSGYHLRDWETFPMNKLKRVDRPTIINDAKVKRVRERDAGFCKAAAGDYGPTLEKEIRRFVPKHPLSGACSWMRDNMKPFVDGMDMKNGRWTSINAPTCGSAIKRDQAAAPVSRFAPGANHTPFSTERSTGRCGT